MLLIIFLLICGITADEQNPIVQTPSGPIQGFTLTTFRNKEIHAFFGIPYAKPPVGELRFKKPVPVGPWTELFQATKLPPACPRTEHFGMWDTDEVGEDCLYLTIAVPKVKAEKIPVVVKIHGGAFVAGSVAALWGNSTTLAGEENVIIVSMNYRLGVMGFLYLNTPSAPGNAGLWDQNLALKWVKENIESFGGDSSEITLLGESAGAGSIHYHILSEHSQLYFSKAIIESGVSNCPWGNLDTQMTIKLVNQLAENVGCLKDNAETTVECLRDVEWLKLCEETEKITPDGLLIFIFAPVTDGDFIKDHPKHLIKDGKFKKSRYLMGAAEEEGIQFAQMFVAKGDYNETEIKITRDHIRLFSEYLSPNNDSMISDAIEYVYTNWTNPELPKNIQVAADKIFGDYYFISCMTDFSNAAVKFGSTVYRHAFAEALGSWVDPNDKHAYHAVQSQFIYGRSLDPANPTPGSLELTLRVMRRWANFVRTG